ncbi:hypothetical protein FQA39_LY00501 [Lamprigera yunnana]|nr:hypothetical protein FQA39_LY00501 [Lamprigera yunnana]
MSEETAFKRSSFCEANHETSCSLTLVDFGYSTTQEEFEEANHQVVPTKDLEKMCPRRQAELKKFIELARMNESDSFKIILIFYSWLIGKIRISIYIYNMADIDNGGNNAKKRLLSDKLKFAICDKLKKNRRKIKRKRTSIKYVRRRRGFTRNRKNTREFRNSSSTYKIADMNYENDCSLVSPIPEVAQWEKQNEIAYWKSRALALQYQNRMLQNHINQVYNMQIQDYVDCKEVNVESESQLPRKRRESASKKVWKAPEVNMQKVRLEALKDVYGTMAPKIAGMETAIQLNYNSYLQKYNPMLWPNLPLKL